MMVNPDENRCRFEAFLEEQGLKEDTIFLYLNDHGATAGANVYNAGMRGRKTQYYEGGHRAACFIRWPAGGLRKPCDLGALTEVQDILPTLMDLARLPDRPRKTLDGTSLALLLRGVVESLPERTLVVQY